VLRSTRTGGSYPGHKPPAQPEMTTGIINTGTTENGAHGAGIPGVHAGVHHGLVGPPHQVASHTMHQDIHNLDNDSPTRLTTRLKDKSRGSRPNHLHKGKTAKDKRKLREKRRSTGVVHMPNTESTGDSLEDEEGKSAETRRNTSYNEVIDADNPQTPEEERISRGYARNARNKSPSDLEADLEDNQDYDSTVSHSETNLTILGSSPTTTPVTNAKFRERPSPDSTPTRAKPSSQREDLYSRPVSYPSRFRELDPDIENLNLGSLRLRDARDYHHHRESHTSPKSVHRILRSASQDQPLVNARQKELEKMLDHEKDDNRRLREENSRLLQFLEGRDNRIATMEKEIQLLQQNSASMHGTVLHHVL
jgi:hypothetical protein